MSTVATLLEQTRVEASAARSQAAADYREILERNDRPQAGDLERLRDVMGVLGRTDEDLSEDLAFVQQWAGLRALIDSIPEREEAQRHAVARQNEAHRVGVAGMEKLKAAIIEADEAARVASVALEQARAARGLMRDWETRWRVIERGISFGESLELEREQRRQAQVESGEWRSPVHGPGAAAGKPGGHLHGVRSG